MSWRNDVLLPLLTLAAWLVPWPLFSLAGLSLLYLLRGDNGFSDDGRYWSAMAVFVISLLLARMVKNQLLSRIDKIITE